MSRLRLISSPDLAIAWGQVLSAFAERGTDEIHPLIVNVAGFSGGFPTEDPMIRQEVDHALLQGATTKVTLCSAETTANVIFPKNLWLRHRASGRDAFFEQYLKLIPRLEKRDRRNRKGTYFSRMLRNGLKNTNQLAHVLDTWNGNVHRRSALQVVIFDPDLDHTRQPFLGFPCLDYVTFTPNTHDHTLSVTALYAEQYVFDRGYGNYLGLCRLGQFVAEQMQLRFNQLTCVASCAKLGEAINKRDARALAQRINAVLT